MTHAQGRRSTECWRGRRSRRPWRRLTLSLVQHCRRPSCSNKSPSRCFPWWRISCSRKRYPSRPWSRSAVPPRATRASQPCPATCAWFLCMTFLVLGTRAGHRSWQQRFVRCQSSLWRGMCRHDENGIDNTRWHPPIATAASAIPQRPPRHAQSKLIPCATFSVWGSWKS